MNAIFQEIRMKKGKDLKLTNISISLKPTLNTCECNRIFYLIFPLLFFYNNFNIKSESLIWIFRLSSRSKLCSLLLTCNTKYVLSWIHSNCFFDDWKMLWRGNLYFRNTRFKSLHQILPHQNLRNLTQKRYGRATW